MRWAVRPSPQLCADVCGDYPEWNADYLRVGPESKSNIEGGYPATAVLLEMVQRHAVPLAAAEGTGGWRTAAGAFSKC